jgi:Rv2525c-like, glycoside hydrolase-like domain
MKFVRAVVYSFLVQVLAIVFLTGAHATPAPHRNPAPAAQAENYLGFDRNIYPGDAALPILRKTFSFASYWISPPPGETSNTWIGKRTLMREQGFGFVVLYRGREEHELKTAAGAVTIGTNDARDAATSAKRETFAPGTIIFLDIEEGGRLSPAYHAYLRAWADALLAAGYRPGVYCSAMPSHEGHGVTITTADDIRHNEAPRDFSYWVYNDACPPAPGCATNRVVPNPSGSGISYAIVWQFAQSPRRKQFTAKCAATYARDGNCYAPADTAHAWFLDLNAANSPDPSGGAK